VKPPHLSNLTLASAKHLLSQGHISQRQHSGIIKKAKKMQGAGGVSDLADETGPGAFGSLNPIQGAGAGHMMSTTSGPGTPEEGY